MNVQAFRAALTERIRIGNETQGEWTWGIEQCWNKEVEILTEDMPGLLDFMKYECTQDEFSWISEIFEEIVEKTRSAEFVAVLWKLTEKFPEETEKYNIRFSIQCAEEYLNTDA